MSALVSGWSALPNAFNKCQLALESHPPINVALQAIFSLQVTVQLTISTYGSCTTCSTLSPNSELALRFKTIITQIFTSWQNFVHLGQNNYGSQWQISTDAVFKKFGTFLIAVKRICSAIKINLGALFGEMRLDANFFPKIGFHAGSPFDLILGILSILTSVAKLGELSISATLSRGSFNNPARWKECLLKSMARAFPHRWPEGPR
ncbi:hypothetical protein PCASD_13686 [Puccinia coronata f. sp. avenae]|uniref:Uncharacterized protein n=1 Tax=Puccinia coronata f. sp. avenae TaxID=200324 RepID=A0A2N5UBY7_9BASI|nr:hypothetical protein PCASD_13686 [Puccinia coronata f. sp. avenae]